MPKTILVNTGESVTRPPNLGSPQEVTVRELSETVIELTSSTSQSSFSPLPEDDPGRRRPNIEAAKKVLGWRTTTHSARYFEGVAAAGTEQNSGMPEESTEAVCATHPR